ncbi:MAG: hydroxyisourate hydrolase [Burkholderiales bacterium]|nr:hydroxyisourate hydrolase [Burkholderiales bacterium]
MHPIDPQRRDVLAAGTLAAGALLAAASGAQAQPALPPKLSTHALDTYNGKQAAGIRIDLYQIEGDSRRLIKTVRANEEGRVTANLLEGDALKVARYELVFHVAEYYKAMGVAQSNPEFLDVVPLRVAIWDARQRYHVPLYFSPWGYMTYRGS